MNAAAIATFVVIAGAVWGGFLVILFVAVRKEREKSPPDGGAVSAGASRPETGSAASPPG